MLERHQQEKEQFHRLFGQQGIDRFEERFQVLASFLKLERHVSLAQIAEQVRQDGLVVDNEFLLECMELLCRFGFASQVVFGQDDTPLYEHRHLGIHHDHMICTKCGDIIEFNDEALESLQEKLTAEYGFFMLQHKMEIYGLCKACMDKRDNLIPLHKARIGEKVEIVQVGGGRKMQMRFASMGLRTGSLVEIISGSIGGQVVVAADLTRLVLCAGMAGKIWVRPEKGGDDDSDHLSWKDELPFSNEAVPLSWLGQGKQGSIARIHGGHFPRRRLNRMGFSQGVMVQVLQDHTSLDYMEVMVRGHRVTLSKKDAARVFVENFTR